MDIRIKYKISRCNKSNLRYARSLPARAPGSRACPRTFEGPDFPSLCGCRCSYTLSQKLTVENNEAREKQINSGASGRCNSVISYISRGDASRDLHSLSPSNELLCTSAVTPTMRLYRVEARLRGITALWFCRKKCHLHTIPCNEQERDK